MSQPQDEPSELEATRSVPNSLGFGQRQFALLRRSHAVRGLLVFAESKPIVNFRSEKPLVCLAAAVLTFFIAGLLYLLRFKHVNNLGAYRIPSRTGILIPSGYVSYHFRFASISGTMRTRRAENPFTSLGNLVSGSVKDEL